MYKNILIPVDNSDHSTRGIDTAIKIAQHSGAKLTGNHVYAARLHDVRFRQMESGLPEKFLEEEELEKQRDVHDTLITKGLEIITDSYLDVFEEMCVKAKFKEFEKRSLEGKNYKEIVNDVEKNKYDLVVIGALGLGTVKESVIGSVCERVVRRVNTDTLVIKNTAPMNGGNIVVAVDGSPQSFGGLLTAFELANSFNKKVSVISAFDPYFHYVAFNSIAGVLSDEAGKVFKFKEQEKLHEEIIDSGLAKIYQAYLDISKQVAKKKKIEIETKLLDGKAFEKILQYVENENPWLLIMGKIGIHSDEGMDIGNNTENILRKVSCNMLISSRKYTPPIEETAKVNIVWTKEAEQRMTKVPSFARGMAKMAILRFATEKGHTVITGNVVTEATQSLLPESARKAMGIIAKEVIEKKAGKIEKEKSIAAPQEEGEEMTAFDGKKLVWEEKALERLENVPAGFMRDNVKLRIEKYARSKKVDFISEEIVSQNLDEGKKKMGGMADMVSKMTSKMTGAQEKSESKKTFEWTKEAEARLERVPAGFMRNMTRSRVEQYAEKEGINEITLDVAEEGISGAKDTMSSMMGKGAPREEETKASGKIEFQIDEKVDYYFCDICGYTVKGFAPDECPICMAAKEKFELVEDKKERVTLSSGRVLEWTDKAEERLQNIPEGFMREMTKWRIEAFVRKNSSLKVTAELIEKKYQQWGEGSKKVEKELSWEKNADEKIEKIPPFVRGMVMKEVENEAKRRGEKTVTVETLSSVRDKWSRNMEFHSEFQKD
ncbi:MAG: universal stress protein [Nitrospinota bacterium]|nr:universal stress protein [Nitrospinota bacterium]